MLDNASLAIDILSQHCPYISKQKLKLAMQYGAVWLTHNNKTRRLRRAKKMLEAGDELHLYYDESILFSPIKAAQLISDEGDYSIWNKPSGMFSQGSKWGDHTSIARWVELFGLSQNAIESRPCFLVHRLDRATSGLIIVAHSKKMATKLSQLFENRQVIKKYRALVEDEFPKSLIGQVIDLPIDNKKAISRVESVEYLSEKQQSQLMIEIKTGRKHQIRKHLSQLGYPIIGDRLYNPEFEDPNQIISVSQADLMLQSYYLQFVCPNNQVIKQYQLEGNIV